MRMAVDATCLGGARAGIWNYTWEILTRLPPQQDRREVDLFLGQSWTTLADYRLEGDGMPRRTLRASLAPSIKKLPGAQAAWTYYKERAFRAGFVQRPCDVLWAPCFLPPVMHERTVLTVHDLSHVRFPQHHPAARVRWLNGLEDALNGARRIIAVSDFTRDEIRDVYRLPAERITVIPNGISERFAPQSADAVARVMARHGLRHGGYFLSVCTLEPRKNLLRLVEAYGRLPESIQKQVPLVLVGGAGWGRDARRATLARVPVKGEVRLLGYVPGADLPALYTGCAAFVYGSLYEGFGLPVAEAMACGAPVVISDAAALVEVAGGHATVAGAHDTSAWTSALESVWSLDDGARADRAAANARFARRYSWAECARRHAELLEHEAGAGAGAGATARQPATP